MVSIYIQKCLAIWYIIYRAGIFITVMQDATPNTQYIYEVPCVYNQYRAGTFITRIQNAIPNNQYTYEVLYAYSH